MRIIKRSGQEVQFDGAKIKQAIVKANLSVDEASKRLTEAQIDDIVRDVVADCENVGRAVHVEEVQDLVEHRIMKAGAFDVAKNYITY